MLIWPGDNMVSKRNHLLYDFSITIHPLPRQFLRTNGSVAVGDCSPPLAKRVYAKYHDFSNFATDLCSKNENYPPLGLAIKIGQGLHVIFTIKMAFSLAQDVSFFFGDHVNLDRKNKSI